MLILFRKFIIFDSNSIIYCEHLAYSKLKFVVVEFILVCRIFTHARYLSAKKSCFYQYTK